YYYQDKYFILDRDQNAIFVFDKDGKFLLSSKDKEGEGPGEYFHLLDFDINYENQTIEIIDVSAYKIRRYTTDFTFLNEINLPLDVYPISSFELLSPDLYCFYESANGTKEVNILKMYSAKKNKIVGEFLPVLKDNRPTTQQNSFYNFEGQIFYTFPFPNNELYRIDISDHSISKVLEYDLGKYNLPYDAFISSHVPGYEYFEEYKDYLFITHKYENSKYYLGFIQKHNDLYAFKYNKATKEMDIISRIFSDGGILLPPALVDEECLYVLTSPQYLDITINPDLLDEKSKDVYRSLQEDDNPVILKYYLK
ncbi:MAG: 6-bladed beta-propeller, partial [Bacteroidales bacterium]|nr:6-bladed beta-propeller [Bacteroidales bacterium]